MAVALQSDEVVSTTCTGLNPIPRLRLTTLHVLLVFARYLAPVQ